MIWNTKHLYSVHLVLSEWRSQALILLFWARAQKVRLVSARFKKSSFLPDTSKLDSSHFQCSKKSALFRHDLKNPRFYLTQANWIVLTFSKLKTLNDAQRVFRQTFFPNHLRFVPGFILFQSLNEGSKATGAVWHLPCPRPLPQCSKPTSV